jgi:membrane protein
LEIVKSLFLRRKKLLAERMQRIGQRLLKNNVVRLVFETVKGFLAHEATFMAAGVSYYGLLSLFPLILGLLAILGFILPSETVQQVLIDLFGNMFPGFIYWLEENFEDLIRLRGPIGIVSLIGLIWAGSALFGAISRAINRTWDVRKDRPYHLRKLRDISMVFGIAILILISMGVTSLLSILTQSDISLPSVAVDIALGLFSFLAVLAVFSILYKYVPNTKVLWRYVWPGALAAAIAFQIAQLLFALYLTTWANYQQTYGQMASLIILLVWVYFAALIVIIGSELSAQYSRMSYKPDTGETV